MAYSTVEIAALYVSELGRHTRAAMDRMLPDCAGGYRVFRRKTTWIQLAFEWEV